MAAAMAAAQAHVPVAAEAAMAAVVAHRTAATPSLRATAVDAAAATMVAERHSRATRRTASRILCVALAMLRRAPVHRVNPIRCAPMSI